jgi:hypothetical protein
MPGSSLRNVWPWRRCIFDPASDIDTVVANSLKALDPKRPIREADISRARGLSALDKEKARPISSVLAMASGPVNLQLLGVLTVSVT